MSAKGPVTPTTLSDILGRISARRQRRAAAHALAAAAWQGVVDQHKLDQLAFSSHAVKMGRGSYGSPSVLTFPGDPAKVLVGQFTSIALDVVLMDGGNHHTDWVSTFPFRILYGLPGATADGQPYSRGDIVIGNDCWIGRGARILPGVTVADGAIVGAYAVVAKNVRPYAVVVGNPAREVSRRFSDQEISSLIALAWWDWPLEDILAAVPLLCGPDVTAFLRRHATDPPAAA